VAFKVANRRRDSRPTSARLRVKIWDIQFSKIMGKESASPLRRRGTGQLLIKLHFAEKAALFVFNEIAGFVWKYATIPLPSSS